MAERWTYLELTKPLLPIICLLLAERKLNQFSITLLRGAERDHVLAHLLEVVSRIVVRARTQTLHRKGLVGDRHYLGRY